MNNGCDGTTFTLSGDIEAKCANGAANIIGPVFQVNDATGLDDVLIDQDNNAAVSQDVSVNNDCDATGLNSASCLAWNNEIDSITQSNDAIGDGFAQISQSNNAIIDQKMTC